MGAFDRVCAVPAFLLGAVFILLGAFGVFFGSNAHFTLPPILGGIPFFVGWGIVRPIWLIWKANREEPHGRSTLCPRCGTHLAVSESRRYGCFQCGTEFEIL